MHARIQRAQPWSCAGPRMVRSLFQAMKTEAAASILSTCSSTHAHPSSMGGVSSCVDLLKLLLN
jgi:hypothetical protein